MAKAAVTRSPARPETMVVMYPPQEPPVTPILDLSTSGWERRMRRPLRAEATPSKMMEWVGPSETVKRPHFIFFQGPEVLGWTFSGPMPGSSWQKET